MSDSKPDLPPTRVDRHEYYELWHVLDELTRAGAAPYNPNWVFEIPANVAPAFAISALKHEMRRLTVDQRNRLSSPDLEAKHLTSENTGLSPKMLEAYNRIATYLIG